MKTDKILVAEFMGAKHIPDSSTTFEHYIIEGVTLALYKIKYDSDWNWLMKVVDKIESLGFWVKMDYGDVFIVDDDSTIIIENPMHEDDYSKLSNVYRVCVDFIDWHNKQTSQKYPFSEGDKYYTIEGSDIIRSYWDDVSEELYDENPSKIYFEDLESALKHLEEVGVRTITIYDGGYAKTVNIN